MNNTDNNPHPKTPFYLSKKWRRVRKMALEYYHYECQECLKVGKYSRATMVHHNLPYRTHPEYGLSLFLFDGTQQLIPLCHPCHEKIETERGNRAIKKERLTNEWW